MAADKLSTYKKKRGFKQTQEPSGSTEVKPSNRLQEALKKRDFKFVLHGKRLHGSFVLVRKALPG